VINKFLLLIILLLPTIAMSNNDSIESYTFKNYLPIYKWSVLREPNLLAIETIVFTDQGPGRLSVYCLYNQLATPYWRVMLSTRNRNITTINKTPYIQRDLTNTNVLQDMLRGIQPITVYGFEFNIRFDGIPTGLKEQLQIYKKDCLINNEQFRTENEGKW